MYFSALTTLAFAFATPVTAAPASHCMETNLLGSPSTVQHALSANDPVKPLDDSSLSDPFILYVPETHLFLGAEKPVPNDFPLLYCRPQQALYFFLEENTLIINNTDDQISYTIGINLHYASPWVVGYICLDTADEWDVPLQMAAEKDDDGTLSLKMTDAMANKYGALAHESFLLELGAKGLHPVHFKIVY